MAIFFASFFQVFPASIFSAEKLHVAELGKEGFLFPRARVTLHYLLYWYLVQLCRPPDNKQKKNNWNVPLPPRGFLCPAQKQSWTGAR
jgi:hypothetical protein